MCRRRIPRTSSMINQTTSSPQAVEYVAPINKNSIYCNNCNFANNIKNAQFCQQCGKELSVCPISRMKFSLNQEFVQCSSCLWVFHKSHLDNWMLKNQKCPICSGSPELMVTGRIGKSTILKE